MSNPDYPVDATPTPTGEPLDVLACLAQTRALRAQLAATLADLERMEEGLLSQALAAGLEEADLHRALGVPEGVASDHPSQP